MNLSQLTFEDAIAARDVALERVSAKAEATAPGFAENAAAAILEHLALCGPTSGEDLTAACRELGLCPHDDRAFGPVYMRLAREGRIRKAGTCKRKRGHGTAGGNVWEIVR